MTRFEWNEAKNTANIRKHGIDFADARELFNHPMLVALDDRDNWGEERWIALGLLKHFVAVVVFAERGDVVRMISARKATKREARKYEQIIQDQLEAPGPDSG